MSKYTDKLTELICDAVKTVFPKAFLDDEYAVADYVIANLPIGEWIENEICDNNDNGREAVEQWQSARCSVCKRYHTTPYMYYFDNFNYCPNCGAKMKGAEE